MNPNEAMEQLKRCKSLIKQDGKDWLDERDIPILDMAIKALKEQKTGKWILSDTQQKEDLESGNYQYFCSNCLYSDIHAKTVTVPFCWHCGAKMEVQDES